MKLNKTKFFNKLFLVVYICTCIFVLILFLFNSSLDLINFEFKFVFLFVISSFLSGIAPNFISLKPNKSFFSLEKEIDSEFSFLKSKFVRYEKEVLFLFLFFLVFNNLFFIDFFILILCCFILLFIVFLLDYFFNFFQNTKFSFKEFFFVFLRYFLELPKLLSCFLILNLDINWAIIVIILTIGSFFYQICYKGIFLLDLLIILLFNFFGVNIIIAFFFILIARFLSSFCNIFLFLLFEKIVNN